MFGHLSFKLSAEDGKVRLHFRPHGRKVGLNGGKVGLCCQIRQIDLLHMPQRLRQGFGLGIGEAGRGQIFDGLVRIKCSDGHRTSMLPQLAGFSSTLSARRAQ